MIKKILVTGANGYIGKHVVTALLNNGVDVIACDVHTTHIDPRATIVNEDIFNAGKDVYQKLNAPDVCIHLAWKQGFFHHVDSHMLTLSGHYHFIRQLLDGGLKQLLVMSSMHEIGYYEGAVDENTPCNPRNLYGVAKDTLRKSVLMMAKDTDVVTQWVRAFYVYGDDVRNQSIFTKLILAEQNGEKTFPFNTGKNKFDFIHVVKLAEQIAAVATQNKIGGIINCCTGVPQTLGNKVEEFIKENNFSIRLEYGAFADRLYDSPGIWGDNNKINQILQNQGSCL